MSVKEPGFTFWSNDLVAWCRRLVKDKVSKKLNVLVVQSGVRLEAAVDARLRWHHRMC